MVSVRCSTKSHTIIFVLSFHIMVFVVAPYFGLNFFIGRSRQVIVNSCSSNPTYVMSTVPHGTVFTPLLFLCYINDLPKTVSSKVRLYADDVLLYNTIHTKEDCLILQEHLNALQLWANKWQMMFNLDKCELIRITNTKLPILYDNNILERKIKVASSVSIY